MYCAEGVSAIRNKVFYDAKDIDHMSGRVSRACRVGKSGKRRAFSSTEPVIAIFAGELFLGVAKGNIDGSGTIRIQSSTKPEVTCSGQFTSSAKLGGTGNMRCSDNSTATIKFQRLTILRGYGTGDSSRGSISFTYGLNSIESEPY